MAILRPLGHLDQLGGLQLGDLRLGRQRRPGAGEACNAAQTANRGIERPHSTRAAGGRE